MKQSAHQTLPAPNCYKLSPGASKYWVVDFKPKALWRSKLKAQNHPKWSKNIWLIMVWRIWTNNHLSNSWLDLGTSRSVNHSPSSSKNTCSKQLNQFKIHLLTTSSSKLIASTSFSNAPSILQTMTSWQHWYRTPTSKCWFLHISMFKMHRL